ncbi:hypothetical protein C8R43DRAFT_897281 [Mycena crocata]|nr:hypothetical protein C8R43DRAFT_897281 [Mycena crocata]
MANLVACRPAAEPSTTAACSTPSRGVSRRALSESPVQIPSPATSTIFDPSPEKLRGGRPRVKNPKRKSRSFHQNLSSEDQQELRANARVRTLETTAQNRRDRAAAKAEAEREAAQKRVEVELEQKRARAKEFMARATLPEEEGGAGFSSVMEMFETVLGDKTDPQASADLTRWLKTHGKRIMDVVVERVPAIGQEFLDEKFDQKLEEILAKEGKAIQSLLTRGAKTSVLELLEEFSMEDLGDQLEKVAPTLWRILAKASTPDATTRREQEGDSRRHKRLVFTTVCAMLSVSRSQKANNYQVVIGLFLLASGASKREMEVLAHAGLSTSYSTIREHIKTLSLEANMRFRKLIKEQMCFIVWDNLNIAFRVESQRLGSGNHFDNGTTGTVIPVYNPYTGGHTPLNTLPLHMKPPRETTAAVIDWAVEDVLPSPLSTEQLGECCLWQLKRIAFDNIKNLEHLRKAFKDCPEVDQITVHLTPQHPVPAMHEDESSIEGTIRVYVQILRNLGVTDADLEAHGLLFTDGDLLTDSLVDKIESARRNSDGPIAGMKATIRRFGLFHAKMAGCRLVVNEHWGKPNSLWPGSLWWEHNKLLKRKPMSAGWVPGKVSPWKPSHELIHMSIAAHVKDGFRIHCGSEDLDAWAASATIEDFDAVAEQVYTKLFTTRALDDLRELPQRDTVKENVVLLNRDALFYIEFVAAIKKGDIGRVVNVLQVWMVMMRTPKTMPKYADAIFETLRRIDRYDPVLKRFFLHNWLVNLTGRPYSFKEVDLLQEHQNFWAKLIYNAKGSNKSWEWLSMITVCIFTLRDTMRTVQKTFQITGYGERHTVPDMSAEIQTLADALRDEKVQEYVLNRPANDPANSTCVMPVRDLLESGSNYADTRGAFKKFTAEVRRAENMGLVDGEVEMNVDSDAEESGREDDYEVTGDDLGIDDEEPYADAAALMAVADEIVTHYV